MRLYTIELEGRELPAAEGKDNKIYTLESLGIPVKDMNELIVRFGTLRETIGQKIAEADIDATAPGTYRIIATGTPGGVAMGMNPPKFLRKGDVVRCEISGIGKLENTVG